MITEELKKRLTSRKFWAVMFWQIVFTVLLWYGKLPVESYVSLTWLILGGYLLANVAQGVLKPKADAEAQKIEVEALNLLHGGPSGIKIVNKV